MIVKLKRPNVSESYEIDSYSTETTQTGAVALRLYKNKELVFQGLLTEHYCDEINCPNAFCRAYVMESGKTVDVIRQERFPEKGEKFLTSLSDIDDRADKAFRDLCDKLDESKAKTEDTVGRFIDRLRGAVREVLEKEKKPGGILHK